MKNYLQALGNREMITTAIRVALIVGSVLFVINHSYALIQGKMDRSRWISAFLSYIVPCCVNIHGQVSGKRKFMKQSHLEQES